MLNHREQLKAIRTFPQLVKYLREKLDWPISRDDFEDISFPYTPEELGIDLKVAAKIQEIRRLRPLTVNQPWGIFFIKFEPKRLPVVALRRMLKAVALKKRATADSAERLSWDTEDLLFISNYGEEDSRQITFAQFTLNEEKKDLPTLKVLGWDNKNTALHLDHVAESLATYLTWPDDQNDTSAWRSSWRSAFTIKHREVIDTAKKLSVQLAHLARNIRERINGVLEFETENGPITKLMNAFKEALVHDLDNDGFADMYAQTIAYGLLSARIANPSGTTADDFASAMPVTNPFLKELMETFIDVGGRGSKTGKSIRLDFDELGVSEVVDLLDVANMEAVVRDFGDKNPLEDPVTHFYEQFFADYDNSERFKRGVFYTPRPVVSFIVSSVDELLRTEFGLEYGLADTTTWGEMLGRIDGLVIPDGATPDQAFVQILDPATGTGTFLVEVIDLINKTMLEKWRAEGYVAAKTHQLWNDYVPKHLLPRLHGYELMMAPYAIAHMKIGLKLYETGYNFESSERARVYLTNSLEPSQSQINIPDVVSALAHEAEAVNTIKRDQRFTIVIGNPPYSLLSANLGEQQRAMIEPYKFIGEDKIYERGALQLEKNLNDDYVKFLRLGQMTIDSSKWGILSFINNHSYLDNPTMRGLRWNLMQSANRIDLVDLHGNSTKREVAPDGSVDKNVFQIKQGVAIITLTNSNRVGDLVMWHSDIWGTATDKEKWLSANQLNTISATPLIPTPEYYLFIPEDLDRKTEFELGFQLDKFMPTYGAGYITARDNLVIDFERQSLIDRVCSFKDSKLEDKELLTAFDVAEKKGWDVTRARKQLNTISVAECTIHTNYRPFDTRHIFFDSSLVWGCSWPTMKHIVGHNSNLSLLATRMTKDKWDVFVARSVSSHKAMSAYDTNSVFPLYLVKSDGELDFASETNKQVNYSRIFLESLAASLSLPQDAKNGLPVGLTGSDIFHYSYAVFQSPAYRKRYHDLLVQQFPRLPLPGSVELFSDLSLMGEELVDLHLLESTELNNSITSFIGSSDPRVEKVSYSKQVVWIDKARTIGFRDVPEQVWNFHIGGYQVCEKWLKDRGPKKGKPGRILTEEDIEHYQNILVTISETIRIMAEIDEVIEAHGGWPGAFQTN